MFSYKVIDTILKDLHVVETFIPGKASLWEVPYMETIENSIKEWVAGGSIAPNKVVYNYIKNQSNI